MTNETSVMFEWPVGSKKMWKLGDSGWGYTTGRRGGNDPEYQIYTHPTHPDYGDHVVGYVPVNKFHKFIEAKTMAELKAKGAIMPEEAKEWHRHIKYHRDEAFEKGVQKGLKLAESQGWLSPADQRPFCMESARELGYKFVNQAEYLVSHKSPDYYNRSHIQQGGEINSFIGDVAHLVFLPVHCGIYYAECARLDAIGVKRYEQGGGE